MRSMQRIIKTLIVDVASKSALQMRDILLKNGICGTVHEITH